MFPTDIDTTLPLTKWYYATVHGNNNRSIPQILYDHIESVKYEEYFQQKWPVLPMNEVYWLALEMNTKQILRERMGSYLKTMHSQWATLDVQAKRASVTKHPRCPFACRHYDSNEHVIRCPRESNKRLRIHCLEKLDETLRNLDTPPLIKDSILQGITLWTGYDNVKGSTLHRAAFQQEKMGWDHMLRGRIHVAWSDWIIDNQKRHEWNATIAKGLIQWSRAVWQLRCREQHRHAHTFIGTAVYKHMKILFNLQATYNLADNQLFAIPLDQRMHYSPRRNQEWIKLAVNSFECRKRCRGKHQSSINRYFNVSYPDPTKLLTSATLETIKRTANCPPTTETEIRNNNIPRSDKETGSDTDADDGQKTHRQ